MKQNPEQSEMSFKEAFEHLSEAIRIERKNNRISIHPYTTLFNGTNRYLKQGGKLSPKESESLTKYLTTAEQLFCLLRLSSKFINNERTCNSAYGALRTFQRLDRITAFDPKRKFGSQG